MRITARRARSIRRGCRHRSHRRENLGISELFTAPPSDAAVILEVEDLRLKRYLLGFGDSSLVGRAARSAESY